MIRLSSSKIPGGLPTYQEGYKQDLKKLDKIHLVEMKEREEKLLSNNRQLNLLPDKGKRIKDFYQKILEEIEKRDEIESTAKLFSELNIVSTGMKKINEMEWTGGANDNNTFEYVDSDDDDDELDPLKILAQTKNLAKIIKILPPEKSLITEEDIQEIAYFNNEETVANNKSINNNVKENSNRILNVSNSSESKSDSPDSELDAHTVYICDKIVDKLPESEKFKPYKTTKCNTHDPEKEKFSKIYKNIHWENTAATPPPIQHNGTKLITLRDSIDIQNDYINKLKNIHENQAAERLKRSDVIKMNLPDENVMKMNKSFTTYRMKNAIENDSSDNESIDEEQDDKFEGRSGTISYTVYE